MAAASTTEDFRTWTFPRRNSAIWLVQIGHGTKQQQPTCCWTQQSPQLVRRSGSASESSGSRPTASDTSRTSIGLAPFVGPVVNRIKSRRVPIKVSSIPISELLIRLVLRFEHYCIEHDLLRQGYQTAGKRKIHL